MENKSKFGLAAGLMGALVYLVGGYNVIALVILFLGIMLYEENEFVKVCAKRLTVVYLGYTLVIHAFGLIDDVFRLIFRGSNFLSSIISSIESILGILYTVLIIFLALKALIHPVVETSILDGKAVDTVANAVSNVAASVNDNVKKSAKKTCPECGKEIASDATFCTSCGAKFGEDTKAE